MPGVAAGQSTSTSAKVSMDARRLASSTAVKVAVAGSARPRTSARLLAGWWGADMGVGGVGYREKNRSWVGFTVLDRENGVGGWGNGRCEGAAEGDE